MIGDAVADELRMEMQGPPSRPARRPGGLVVTGFFRTTRRPVAAAAI